MKDVSEHSQHTSSSSQLLSTWTYSVERNQIRCCCGFTIPELLIVVAIMTTLAAIAMPVGSKYVDHARIKRAIAEIHMLEKEITIYSNENGTYPNGLDDIGQRGLLDPWGNLYEYLNIADLNPPKNMIRKDRFLIPVNSDYDLYSRGKDGETLQAFQSSKARDDIVRANDGQYVGLAEYF